MAKKTARSVSGAKRVSAAKPIRRAWQYCPKCGQPGVERGKNPFRCQSCGYTHFFGPVSAVGAITTDAAGQVLLLVRAKDPGKGKYGLPGGFIDAGETAEEALHREVREETGLRVRSSRYLISFPNEYVYQGFILPVTDLFFVTEVHSFDELAAGDGEISGWHFCHPGRRELKRMAFESNRRALELFIRQHQ
jgi:ADP-ribose pyrophosphatase